MISNSVCVKLTKENENISVVDETFPSFWKIIQSGEFCYLVVVREKSSVFLPCSLCLRAREPSMLG